MKILGFLKIYLDKFEIKSKLISNHKFNERKNLSKIIEFLKKSKIISLISDAGTPGISDPGAILINECIKKNDIQVSITRTFSSIYCIIASGFSEKYFFYGFFPEKEKILNEDLKILSNLNCSIIFFISPKK